MSLISPTISLNQKITEEPAPNVRLSLENALTGVAESLGRQRNGAQIRLFWSGLLNIAISCNITLLMNFPIY